MSFDFLSGINTLGGGLLGYLIPFLFVLTLVVFFHELGHFLVARRAAIVVAGPVANFLLAIVIFAALFMVFGKPSTSPRVDAVQPGSAAEAAGFQPGDLVLTIDGRPVESFPDMQQIVSTSAGE